MEIKKHTDAKKKKQEIKKSRNLLSKKSTEQREDIQANDRRKKTTIQKCQKEKLPHNKEIP